MALTKHFPCFGNCSCRAKVVRIINCCLLSTASTHKDQNQNWRKVPTILLQKGFLNL